MPLLVRVESVGTLRAPSGFHCPNQPQMGYLHTHKWWEWTDYCRHTNVPCWGHGQIWGQGLLAPSGSQWWQNKCALENTLQCKILLLSKFTSGSDLIFLMKEIWQRKKIKNVLKWGKKQSSISIFVAEYLEKPNDLKRHFFDSYFRKTLFLQ